MRGEDLLNQRGSRARQSNNENRIRVRRPNTHALRDELLRANVDLLARADFGNLRTVAAFGALECVATLVELPGFRVVVQVFVCFAKRKTEMGAVNGVSRRCGHFGSHVRDFIFQETIGLEISKAPIGVAETWCDGCCLSVGLDRVFATSHALKGVAERHMQISLTR